MERTRGGDIEVAIKGDWVVAKGMNFLVIWEENVSCTDLESTKHLLAAC